MKRRSLGERIKLIWLGERQPSDPCPASDRNREAFQAARTKIEAAVAELEGMVAQFDVSTLLPLVTLLNMARSSQVRKGYADAESPAFIEYLTAIAVRKPCTARAVPTIEQATEIRDNVERLFWDCNALIGTERADPENTDGAWEEVLNAARMHYMLVRGETNHSYFLEAARRLFGSQDQYLAERFGFNIEQAIRFVDLFAGRALHKYHLLEQELSVAFRVLAQTNVNSSIGPIVVYKPKRHTPVSPTDRDVLDRLPSMARDMFTLPDTEVASMVGPDERESMVSFLNWASIVPEQLHFEPITPLSTNPLENTPIIRLDGAYLLHNAAYLSRCLVYALDKALMRDPSYRDKYSRIRGAYLENETANLFSKIFPSATVYHNLKYNIAGDGKKVGTELDALVQFDNTIFLIECATHPVTDPSKRGAGLRIKDDLRQSIERTYRQAQRACDYIKTTDVPIFTLPNRTQLKLDKESIQDYFLISVTLDAFDVYTATPKALESMGMHTDVGHYWPVYIEHLRLISQFIEFPSQFVHYLRKRMSMPAIIYASEECDYFGSYLIMNLQIPNPPGHKTQTVFIINATSDFDLYYDFMDGVGPRVPRPAQFIPKRMKSILRKLERDHAPGHSDIACLLLDFDFVFRKLLDENMLLALQRSKDASGDMKDFSAVSPDGTCGVTYFCGDCSLASNTPRAAILPDFCLEKLNQTRSRSWLGILRDTSRREPYLALVFGQANQGEDSTQSHGDNTDNMSTLPRP